MKTGNGQIVLTWTDPLPANTRPNAASIQSPSAGTRLKANSVTIKALVSDNNKNKVRIRVQFSHYSDFRSISGTVYSGYVDSGKVASVTVALTQGFHYYVRVWAQDSRGSFSLGYAGTNFYSNYPPDAPTLLTPAAGAQITGIGTTNFTWSVNDPDGETQASAQIQWQRDQVDNPTVHTNTINSSQHLWTEPPFTFSSNHFYVWRVRTKDPHGAWGAWSDWRRFYVSGVSTPPRPISPIKESAVSEDDAVTFKWKFVDPDPGDTQRKADIRWRVKGQDDNSWIQHFGDTTTPGATGSWTWPANTFDSSVNGPYEWQVRTYDTLGGGVVPSGWSDSAFFRVTRAPGRLSVQPVPDVSAFAGTLGCGQNEAYLAVKGGRKLLGKLGPASSVVWSRVRDDISKATITLNLTAAPDTCQLAAIMRCWQHEVVIFRNGERVWEGPITRIAYRKDSVEIEASDVMAWVYRRIMKQGYDDSYPNLRSVVERAERIIVNALAPDDPEVIPYLTSFNFPDDAKQSRIVPDWSKTAWEEVDDLAQKAGLDYTTVGRRIILWDTHRPIGRLPVMTNGDFGDDPIVTEYGMNFATLYGITNGNGVWGSASKSSAYTGPVEMLSSSYGDSAAASDQTLTTAAKRKLVESFNEQAARGIADRWPIPMVVRVPDNTTLNPEVQVPINYWVPGVWIPLTATHVCREFSQWQKLDSMTVTQTEAGETIQVVMSPAPGAGEDPDADAGAETDGD